MMTYVYKRYFMTGISASANYGYASSLAIIAAIILGAITFVYLKYTNKQANIY
jgi:ABC-type sugar transport system permease subunit